ncbi:MAG: type II secretion system F family protein [Ilumatobacteraceae bacterium]
MTYLLVGTATWTLSSIVLARHVVEPLLFRIVTRRRLFVTGPTQRRASGPASRIARFRLNAPLARPRRARRSTPAASTAGERYADTLDSISRELRLGASLHAAVVRSIQRHQIHEWSWLETASSEGRMLTGLVCNARDHHDRFALRAIEIAAVGGDAVHAVETAARTMRSTAAIEADSRSAVAHTRTSIAVLTWVPVFLASWLLVRHPAARTFFVSPVGLACLCGGIGLQWGGRRWVGSMARHAQNVDSHVADFVDVVNVHLRAGSPPARAFLAAIDGATGDVAEASRNVARLVREGMRFCDALMEQRRAFGPRAQALVDGLIDTERDGLPPGRLFERLAADAHTQRRREAEARIRSLPVRLTLPLVGCILPAYVMLAVIPLLASQFSSVNVGLQS